MYYVWVVDQEGMTLIVAVPDSLDQAPYQEGLRLRDEPVDWHFARVLMYDASLGRDRGEFKFLRIVKGGNEIEYYRAKGEIKSRAQLKAYMKRNKINQSYRKFD